MSYSVHAFPEVNRLLVADDPGLRPYLSEGLDYIIDIGSHVGGFMAIAKILFPAAKVIAYEPFQGSYEASHNMAGIIHGGFKHHKDPGFPLTVVHKKALGNGDPVSLHPDWKIGWNWLGSLFSPASDGGPGEVIESVTLQDIINENQVDLTKKVFVKVDCECGEYHLMNDESVNILRQCHHIFVEVHFPGTNVGLFHEHPECVEWEEHDSWIRGNYADIFNIEYLRSNRHKGYGHYRLVRK